MDYLTLRKHCIQLNEELKDHPLMARACQLAGGGIGLILKRKESWACFVIQLGSASQGIWLASKWEEVDKPSPFCTAINRKLINGRLDKIKLLGDESQNCFDRVVELRWIVKDNFFGTKSAFRLICELTGRVANIILCDDEFQIIEMKKNTANNDVKSTYNLPDSINLLNPFVAEAEEINTCLLAPQNTWMDKIGAISPLFCKELVSRIKQNQAETSGVVFQKLFEETVAGEKTYLYTQSGKVKGLFLAPVSFLQDSAEEKAFSSVNAAMNFIEQDVLRQRRINEIRKRVVAKYKKDLKFKTKLLAEQEKLQKKYESGDKYKKLGDLILSNLHAIKPRSKTIEVEDWETQSLIKIDLDPEKTASANAQRYFHLCKKAQRGIREVEKRIKSLSSDIAWLKEQLWLAETAETETDLTFEFESKKKKKLQNKKKKNSKGQKGRRKKVDFKAVLEIGKCRYFVGRNGKQNDALTFSFAKKGDRWFHANDVPGGHVILKKSEGEISEDEITIGAMLAAWFSFAKDSSKVPVDSTDAAFVKRIPGGGPGNVNYTHQKTYFVNPQDAQKLLQEQNKEEN